MKNLQERVQRMLDGEKKRREIALKWLEEVTEVIKPVAEDIWGSGVNFGGGMETYTTDILKIDKEGKKREAGIYFRYKKLYEEYTGFYDDTNCNCNTNGTPIEDLRGKDFWYSIQVIIDWIPQVLEAMEKREISRDQLLEKIKIA